MIRLGEIYEKLGFKNKAGDYFKLAIGTKPNYPDAYNSLGQIYYNRGIYNKAVEILLLGITKKPPYHSIVVYNPRDYDFHPMMLLGKTFYAMSRPDQALTCLEACKKIDPKHTEVERIITELKKSQKFFDKALIEIENIERQAEKDTTKLPSMFAKLPDDIQSHPGICALRNKYIIKYESSGKDIAYYCGFTEFPWSPSIAKKKGIGGSEEAVINLSKEWVKAGYNVTVYCNTGGFEEESDGVHYKPFWMWNYRDKQDITVLWRQCWILDKVDINSTKIFVDAHDVMPEGEFTPDRLSKISKILVKTDFHRSLFPNISDDKFAIIPNGMDFELFKQSIKKEQYTIVNTSSPDRSCDILPIIFEKIKARVPEARLKWCYGFELFDKLNCDFPIMMKWSSETKQAMDKAGIENLGRLSQKECAKLYLEGNILLYPTEFAEIDCITVKKAQACGCLPVTTDFGALAESVKSGIKIHSNKNKNNWCQPNQFHFGSDTLVDEFVDRVVEQLQQPIEDRADMKDKMEMYRWERISSLWVDEFIK